jgi:ABC-type antimicrobial peptide transport system permease subunit
MELKVNLQVSANEVFEQLLKSLGQDIKNSTGQMIASDKLSKDFSYKKSIRNHMGYVVQVKVKINELIRPIKYSATIENPNGVNTIEYTLTETAKGVEIVYKENYKASSTLQNWNYILASIFFSRRGKKKMRKQFSNLEQQILNTKSH